MVANFDGGTCSFDGSLLLLRELAGKLQRFLRLAQCLTDFCVPDCCEHGVEQMLARCVLSLAMGYEDPNDHGPLRHGPLVELLLEAHREAPKRMVLNLDGTEAVIRGHQEGRFFQGFYGHYCCLPLDLFCG